MLLLIAPAATVLFLFQIFPILIGANASFRNWPLYDPSGEWLGLHHYIRVLTDPVFLGRGDAEHALADGALRQHRAVPRARARASFEPRLPWAAARADGAAAAADDRAGDRVDDDALDVQRPVRHRRRGVGGAGLRAPGLARRALAGVRDHRVHRRLDLDAVVHDHPARRPQEPAARALRGGGDRRRDQVAHVHPPHAADAAAGDRGLRRDPRDRRVPHLRSGLGDHPGRPGAADRGVQRLRLCRGLPQPELRARLGGGDHRRHRSSWCSASRSTGCWTASWTCRDEHARDRAAGCGPRRRLLRRARAGRQEGAVRPRADRRPVPVRLPGVLADPDLAAPGLGRLLRASRHRLHDPQLRRGAAGRHRRPGLRQQLHDRHARHGASRSP